MIREPEKAVERMELKKHNLAAGSSLFKSGWLSRALLMSCISRHFYNFFFFSSILSRTRSRADTGFSSSSSNSATLKKKTQVKVAKLKARAKQRLLGRQQSPECKLSILRELKANFCLAVVVKTSITCCEVLEGHSVGLQAESAFSDGLKRMHKNRKFLT